MWWCSAVGFIVTLALSLLVAPLAPEAQTLRKVYRIGYLSPGSPGGPSPDSGGPSNFLGSLRQELHTLGYVEGQNIVFELRYTQGYDRSLDLAAELVHLGVDVIVTNGTPAAQAAKQATATIPIVTWRANTAIETGLVAGLPRPGGNITGVVPMPELIGKRLELLREVVPSVSRVGILWDPENQGAATGWQHAQVAAQALGITVISLEVPPSSTLERLFAAITQERPEALLLFTNPFPNRYATEIAAFAAKNGLPTFGSELFVKVGGLMSYSSSIAADARRVAYYVDRILKGAKPAELPVEQPTKFELIINLKTAKALGITMPPSLLLLADEVIQ